jgi:hypothetical protein
LGPGGSSTTKTGRHDIVEILLKVALKHQKINQSINLLNNVLWTLKQSVHHVLKTLKQSVHHIL